MTHKFILDAIEVCCVVVLFLYFPVAKLFCSNLFLFVSNSEITSHLDSSGDDLLPYLAPAIGLSAP